MLRWEFCWVMVLKGKKRQEKVKCVQTAKKKMILIIHHEIYSNVKEIMIWRG